MHIPLNCLALYVVPGAVVKNAKVFKKRASVAALEWGRFLTPL